jgi:hypothetical protein
MTSDFRARNVKSSTFKRWVSKFPGQSTYLSMQIWFTQRLLSIFAGASDKGKQVE